MARAVGVALVCAGLIGPTTTEAWATTRQPLDVGVVYLRRVFATTPATVAAAQRLTAPGSLAERYAVASTELATAITDAAERVPPTTITKHGSELHACTVEVTTTQCATFAAFRSDRHGRLVSFTINHLSLAGRFAIDAGQSDAALGVTGNLDIAYESPTPPTLLIVFSVRGAPDGARAVDVSSATYVGPDGHARQPHADTPLEPPGPLVVGPEVRTLFAVAVPGAPLGGTLTVPVVDTQPGTDAGTLRLTIG